MVGWKRSKRLFHDAMRRMMIMTTITKMMMMMRTRLTWSVIIFVATTFVAVTAFVVTAFVASGLTVPMAKLLLVL